MSTFASKIFNTMDRIEKVPVFMLIYGNGGIGKTTFGSTAPFPILADLEHGAKYLGVRGIRMAAANIERWSDFAGPDGFVQFAIKNDKIQTIVVDPLDQLLEKAKLAITGTKLKQPDGSLTVAGWGELKTMMTRQFHDLRDSGKNVILIAHVEEKEDDGRLVKRPKLQTKLSEDIVNMVDIVAYMTSMVDTEGETIRVITVDPSNDKITAKDRTGSLPVTLAPTFTAVQEALTEAVNKRMAEIGKKKSADKPEGPEITSDQDSADNEGEIADKPVSMKERAKATLEAATTS